MTQAEYDKVMSILNQALRVVDVRSVRGPTMKTGEVVTLMANVISTIEREIKPLVR